MRRVEKILFGCLVAILLSVAAGSAYVIEQHVTRCDRFHFDPARWRESRHSDRTRIADRLVTCKTLDGLNRAEVRERLGKPIRAASTRRRWTYYVGATSGGYEFFSTEIDLAVTFSRAGEVRRVAVVDGPKD